MNQRILNFAVLVHDYDQALAFYTGSLGFSVVEDTDLGAAKRWLRVAPPGAGDGAASVLLSRATTPAQAARVGDQTGGRVLFYVETDDLDRDMRRFASRGVTILELPRDEPYGRIAVIADLYGNRIDWIEPARDA